MSIKVKGGTPLMRASLCEIPLESAHRKGLSSDRDVAWAPPKNGEAAGRQIEPKLGESE